MEMSYFDSIFISCVAISAIYLTADTAVKQSDATSSLGMKLPEKIRSVRWGYLPLVLMSIAGLILGAKALGLVQPQKPVETVIKEWPLPYYPIAINGKTFINERVELDGRAFVNCTFTNVTFVYNGTTA